MALPVTGLPQHLRPEGMRRRAAKKPVKPGKERKLTPVEMGQLPQYFSELFFSRKQYRWCGQVLEALAPHGSRVALVAANGSGKTSEVVAVAVLWHMIRYPGSQTVVTAGVYRQIAEVLWPLIRNRVTGMGPDIAGNFDITENRIIYRSPSLPGEGPREPSMCNGFSAEKPEAAEGWHGRGPSGNLLYVIDEAKAVPDGIFDAMERCQPTRLLVVSSPGGAAGRFYEIFKTGDKRYKTFKVTSYDCPHIEKKWVDEQIAAYGIKSAVVQSMIFAEFCDEDGASLVLPSATLQKCLSSPPMKAGTHVRVGSDFAAGGDENVIYPVYGNDASKPGIYWREKDTMTAIGRFVTEFKRLGVEQGNVWADGSGIGIPMCDALREAGWQVNRVNNGEAAFDNEKFANRGTEMWVQFARLVETCKIILPKDDEVLHRQLTTRRLEHNSKGKLIVEPKDKMKKRGLDSPDRADALILAVCGGGQSIEEYMQKQGRRASFDDIMDEMGEGQMAGAWAG